MESDNYPPTDDPNPDSGPGDPPELLTKWDDERVEVDREDWERVVDYNVMEIERFTYTLLGGLQENLWGRIGLDERDDPHNHDYQLSTLRRVGEHMGGHLEVAAVFAGVRIPADVSGTAPLWQRPKPDDELIPRLTKYDDY